MDSGDELKYLIRKAVTSQNAKRKTNNAPRGSVYLCAFSARS
jgi:hypothetical protein